MDSEEEGQRLSPPFNLSAVNINDNFVDIAWDTVEKDVKAFSVQFKTHSQKEWPFDRNNQFVSKFLLFVFVLRPKFIFNF